MNADFAALFSEKKYKEMMAFASQAQENLLRSSEMAAKPLLELVQEANNVSFARRNIAIDAEYIEFSSFKAILTSYLADLKVAYAEAFEAEQLLKPKE